MYSKRADVRRSVCSEYCQHAKLDKASAPDSLWSGQQRPDTAETVPLTNFTKLVSTSAERLCSDVAGEPMVISDDGSVTPAASCHEETTVRRDWHRCSLTAAEDEFIASSIWGTRPLSQPELERVRQAMGPAGSAPAGGVNHVVLDLTDSPARYFEAGNAIVWKSAMHRSVIHSCNIPHTGLSPACGLLVKRSRLLRTATDYSLPHLRFDLNTDGTTAKATTSLYPCLPWYSAATAS